VLDLARASSSTTSLPLRAAFRLATSKAACCCSRVARARSNSSFAACLRATTASLLSLAYRTDPGPGIRGLHKTFGLHWRAGMLRCLQVFPPSTHFFLSPGSLGLPVLSQDCTQGTSTAVSFDSCCCLCCWEASSAATADDDADLAAASPASHAWLLLWILVKLFLLHVPAACCFDLLHCRSWI